MLSAMAVQKCCLQCLAFWASLTLIACGGSGTPTSADIEAVRERIEAFEGAWNAHSPSEVAALVSEDATLAFPSGPWFRGRAAFEQGFSFLDGMPAGRKITLKITDQRFVSPDVALADVEAEITGGGGTEGAEVLPIWDCATYVLKKRNGAWEVEALRVMLARNEPGAVEEAIDQSWREFKTAWTSGDAEGAASFYTETALNLRPAAGPDVGHEGVEAAFTQLLASASVEAFDVETLELEIVGDHAFERGTIHQVWRFPNGRRLEEVLRYYAQWRRETDGRWRFHRFLLQAAGARPGG